MRKMVFLMNVQADHLEQVKKIAPEWEIIHGKEPEIWLPHLQEAEIVAGWKTQCKEACFNPNAPLRWIQSWSAGVDNIPFDLFLEKQVFLTNANGVHPYPISETIFGMLLSFTRKLNVYSRQQMTKKWYHAHNGLEMHGKTIGIVGVGAIGRETARLAKAFGMRVIGLRRSGEPMEHVDQMVDRNGLNTLLSHSDYVVVTLPWTAETYHMFGKQQFKQMKETAFFINIGRGQTTDTNALMEALQEKQIAGAGLDVFEEEPLPQVSPLWEMENVIITPHTSGSTMYYNDRVMDIFLPNLEMYLQGKEPSINKVNMERRY